ncbi:hypothetical protein B0H67DRAFT_598242 [Lasiosphaeris hirsuta]|uniref:PH domain-containing protein n=1 Tax=Lasiosphaeris hirsuta TaxID=260670 RepID=A0AA40AZ93_9PEZI|nr:hypothetical protein B0H67DRAFT_598242 [Lasiosphaeris hirsuta]
MATAKSPVAAPSPHINPDRGGAVASYFPQQPQQQYGGVADAETLSNTLANSHTARPDYGSHLVEPSALRPTGKFTEEWDASQRGSSIIDGSNMQRSSSFSGSVASVIGEGGTALSRGNTLKKKASLRRTGSLKRSSSRRSMKAGSVRSLALQSTTDQDEIHSAFYCPIPTTGSPTEVLANRFQAWRKFLKDLITYFREIQTHYEHRAKSLVKLANVLNNTTTPPGFLASGGKLAVAEANKAREIEEDVILALTGLRSDLHQKIKEIKNLSGDFKNSVEKEMDTTRRAVNQLQDILGQAELDSALTTGKQDPYLLRLAVDRQLEKQIDEENYLHQAYLNLENSGRELESIVVGEIQKSYNAYAGILKRESDAAYSAIEELRTGPIAMPKDTEWGSFVQRDDRFVDPEVPMRSAELIHYPGRDHYACQEIRAGLLERKSKYLKSYTAGWYVLSPTHLHEFKSADKTQAPVMSLYLPEQKLGSHSSEGGSSNKFILKGRQTGSMHRGHTWVFRAESHDTMMAWYEDIKALTERTPEERSNFVRGHVRSFSRSSQRSSMSSDGVIDDDEDPPFAATVSPANQHPRQDALSRRPSGGRFPSDLQVNAERGLQVPLSPLSAIAAASPTPQSSVGQTYQDAQYLGQYPGQYPGQHPGQYLPAPTLVHSSHPGGHGIDTVPLSTAATSGGPAIEQSQVPVVLVGTPRKAGNDSLGSFDNAKPSGQEATSPYGQVPAKAAVGDSDVAGVYSTPRSQSQAPLKNDAYPGKAPFSQHLRGATNGIRDGAPPGRIEGAQSETYMAGRSSRPGDRMPGEYPRGANSGFP